MAGAVWRWLACALMLAACRSAALPVPEERALSPRAGRGDVNDEVARWNAEARQGAVEETVHGVVVRDPYRSLEADTPATRAWIEAQTSRTREALAALEDPTASARLQALLGIGSIGAVSVGGERVFVTLREGTREQAALYLVDEGAVTKESLADPLIDPLGWGERAALDWAFPSPDGRYVAFGISENGDERSVLRVIDVASRKLLREAIAHTKWTSLSWLNDASGFYYSRYPRAGESDYDANEQDTYFPRVFFHRLGADDAIDERVYGSDTKTDFPYVAVGDDDRHVVVGNFRGWTASDVYLFDRGAKAAARVAAPDAAHPLVPVVTGEDKLTTGVVHQGWLYLVTNLDAPKKRIVRASLSHPADRKAWRTVVAEGDAPIEDWALTRDAVLVHYVANVRSRLSVFGFDGAARGDIPLPTGGSMETIGADPRSPSIAFAFDSFFYPPTLFVADVAGRLGAPPAPTRVHQVAHDLDTAAYALSEANAQSKDGTPVHLYYVHKKDLARTGDNPVLLTGYGGFDVSLLPEFTRTALYWLERGGVYAVANLRGGGEYGEAWHRAGMLGEKERVFEDMEAVIRWFADSGISRPGKIAISGGSNGGLLMGAMITRASDTFRAAVADVGLYDMLRYTHFPPAELWVSEYGDPAQPDAAKWLLAYSPYHQVRDGVGYPSVLIETADHDTRVSWAHSTKFAARLQDAQAGPLPIYFHMEQKQGHGRGTRLSDLVRRYVRRYAFLEDALGMGGR